jgi:salicylate hydroxylase
MLPYSAQGGAMAIEDAWVLGEVLAGAADPVAALACYSQRRVARVTRVHVRAARNANIFHRSGRVSRFVRDAKAMIVPSAALPGTHNLILFGARVLIHS